MLPNESKKMNELWFVKIIESDTQKLINDKFYGGKKEVAEGEENPITVQLLNGSGNSNNLEKVLKLLEDNGFDVVKVGNTTKQKTTSIINRTKQSDSTVSKISNIMNVKSKKTTGKDNVDADLTITIGSDFK